MLSTKSQHFPKYFPKSNLFLNNVFCLNIYSFKIPFKIADQCRNFQLDSNSLLSIFWQASCSSFEEI